VLNALAVGGLINTAGTNGWEVVGHNSADLRAFLGSGGVTATICVAILVVAYGVVIIATARGPRLKPDAIGYGIIATPGSQLWYGLAFVIPVALTWGGALIFPNPTTSDSLSWEFLYWSGPTSFTVCFLLAHNLSVRPVKRAILAGRAPGYRTSPDDLWWWDGGAWVSVAAAPEAALRSPNGNFWWTGHSWVALPPRRVRA
jgi:hypothetical protein